MSVRSASILILDAKGGSTVHGLAGLSAILIWQVCSAQVTLVSC